MIQLHPTPHHDRARLDTWHATTWPARLRAALARPGDIPPFCRRRARQLADRVRLAALRQRHGPTLQREVQGSTMVLDLDDQGIQRTLAIHGIREPAFTRAYQQALADRDPDLVADVGANVGYFALMALSRSTHVVAIEPGPHNLAALQRNVALNGYSDRVHIKEGAVGDQHRDADLQLSPRSNLHALADARSTVHHAHEDSIRVQERPLGWYLDAAGFACDDLDVIRMDVEGYERQVIGGLERIPRDCLLAMEWHGRAHDAAAADELLGRLIDADAKLRGAYYDGAEVTRHVRAIDRVREYRLLNLLIDIP